MTMTGLVERNAVTDIVAARDASLSMVRQACDLLAQAQALLIEAEDVAVKAHGGATFYLGDHGDRDLKRLRHLKDLPIAADLDVYRRWLDGRVWVHMQERTGMARVMDAEAKRAYREMLAKGAPEVTEASVWGSIDGAREEASLYFRRGLATAFSTLDKRFKSHSAFKFKSRIILTNVFTSTWLNYHHPVYDRIEDIERCFAVLAGDEPDPQRFRKELEVARKAPGFEAVETRYFKVRGFQNGNAHLWIRDRALLDRVNLELAAYYGEVLPDAVAPDVDPNDARSKTGALSKDLAFYATSPATAKEALQWVWRDGMRNVRVLEPSAGEGGLCLPLLAKGAQVHAIEVHPGRHAQLRALARREPRLTATLANFLRLTPTGDYDAVVMNPPFVGTHCLEHVMHAFDFLRDGGKLVAILPAGAQVRETKKHQAFKAWLKGKGARWHDLPPESFAASGTRVQTVVLTLTRRG